MSVLSQAKRFYNELNVRNGWDDDFIKKKMTTLYSPEKVEFFMRFYGCLLGERFCNPMTELYIKTPLISMRDTVKEYNNIHKENPINENTGLSQIIYCTNKLKSVFTNEEMLNDIWNGKNENLFQVYQKQLNDFIDKYGVKGGQNKELIVNIPSYKRCGEVTSKEFISFLRLLEPYSKQMIKKIQKEINSKTKEIGYFNYITKPGISLTPQELADKELVEIMLGHRDGEFPREEKVFDFEEYKTEEINEPKDDLVPDFTIEEDEPLIDLVTPPLKPEEPKEEETWPMVVDNGGGYVIVTKHKFDLPFQMKLEKFLLQYPNFDVSKIRKKGR